MATSITDTNNNLDNRDYNILGWLMSSSVNHPAHYTDGKIEVIDFIEDKNLDFHTGNAVKYIARAGKKDPSKEIEDLQKAIWYLNRKIERLQNEP